MTTAIRHDHRLTQFIKSVSIGILALSPSLATGMYLLDNSALLEEPYQTICLILLIAAIDLALLVILDPYRRDLSKLTLPALFSTMAIVLLFIITESINRFFEHLGYTFLTPFVIACIALIYTAIFLERNIALKFYLSLNSIAVIFLCVLGATNRIMMPF